VEGHAQADELEQAGGQDVLIAHQLPELDELRCDLWALGVDLNPQRRVSAKQRCVLLKRGGCDAGHRAPPRQDS